MVFGFSPEYRSASLRNSVRLPWNPQSFLRPRPAGNLTLAISPLAEWSAKLGLGRMSLARIRLYLPPGGAGHFNSDRQVCLYPIVAIAELEPGIILERVEQRP